MWTTLKAEFAWNGWTKHLPNLQKALEFATSHVRDFVFRGREVKQVEHGHIDVSMRNSALSMKNIRVDNTRKKQLEDKTT